MSINGFAFTFDLQRFTALPGTQTFDSYSNKQLNTHRAHGNKFGPNGGSDDANQLPITTTNVSIFSNDMRIGFVQSFTASENREITPIQELGTEGVVQMVPGNTRGGTIQLQRVALYNSDIWNALGLTPTGVFTQRAKQTYGIANTLNAARTYGNPFRTLKDQRVPLELRAETVLPDADSMLVETYYDCWLASWSKTIQAAQVWISEQVSIEYSDMDSKIKENHNTRGGGDANDIKVVTKQPATQQ